ncbi:MAG: ribosome maturation factor RimP [Clostridiales Family XIII bacterium]|jgi:ribosome maturation factor RimP|nr:ribosome maturation factor RimP [Clostridiales Family XIII bacterium]
MSKKSIVRIVKELLAEFLPQNGYELWHAEFVKEGKDYNLKVYIDSAEGIGADDCEKVSRYLGARLDEADPIEAPYYLIVSSPGMDRALLTPDHFRRYVGCPVDVALYKGVDGKKSYSGILGERTDEYLILYADGEIRLPIPLIGKVRLQVIF